MRTRGASEASGLTPRAASHTNCLVEGGKARTGAARTNKQRHGVGKFGIGLGGGGHDVGEPLTEITKRPRAVPLSTRESIRPRIPPPGLVADGARALCARRVSRD